MKPLSKSLLVIAGYVLAIIVATMAVSIYVAATDGPDRESAGGMYAFGDSIVFLAVFGLAAIPASSAALFFLRPCRSFWRVASVVAPVIAATGIAAAVSYLVQLHNASTDSLPGAWSALSPLRILLAPLFAIAFFLCGVFAPGRSDKGVFLGAAAVEVAVFVWPVLKLFRPFT